MVFFRFEGVYQYCIDTYGAAFVEKYIGNLLSNKQVKQLAGKAIVLAVTGVTLIGLNIADQGYNAAMYNKEMDIEITRRKNLGQRTLTFNEYNEMQDNIRKHHLPFLSRVSQTLPWVKKK